MNSSNVDKLEADELEVALSIDALGGTWSHCSVLEFKISFLRQARAGLATSYCSLLWTARQEICLAPIID